ncbi:MAG TPA: ATP synthase subunit I [Kofleriaceae bacterium]|jgi:hypothetical protein
MPNPSILRIERLNYALGGIAIVIAALTQTRPIALGLTIGVVLTCANFFVLRKLVVRWTADAAAGKPSKSGLLVVPKMLVLGGLVIACLAFLPIDPFAFAIGYSMFFASIVIELLLASLLPARDESDGKSNG